MFERTVPAVEGDLCSECGQHVMHVSGLTWADARAKDAEAKLCHYCSEREATGEVVFVMQAQHDGMPFAFRSSVPICSECGEAKMAEARAAVDADDDPNFSYHLTERPC